MIRIKEPVTKAVTKSVTRHTAPRDTSHPAIQTLHAMAGQPCPLCGQRVPTKRQAAAAIRQRASRARRKGNA